MDSNSNSNIEIIVLVTLILLVVTADYRWLVIPVVYLAIISFQTKLNLTEDYSLFRPEPLEPTLNDPFMNNLDSDVLKVLPKETKKMKQKQDQYFHWDYYKDEDNVYDKTYDGLHFYTTPPDDQEAFIKFLQYDLQVPQDIQYNDLKKDRYLFPTQLN